MKAARRDGDVKPVDSLNSAVDQDGSAWEIAKRTGISRASVRHLLGDGSP